MKPIPVGFILKCSDKHFTSDELKCLQQFGHQLQSVATGHVPPTGSDEEEFVSHAINVNEGKSISTQFLEKPTNLKFQVFLKYMAILLADGNPLEITSRKTTEARKRRLEDRAQRGGFSTDDQENRFKR